MSRRVTTNGTNWKKADIEPLIRIKIYLNGMRNFTHEESAVIDLGIANFFKGLDISSLNEGEIRDHATACANDLCLSLSVARRANRSAVHQ